METEFNPNEGKGIAMAVLLLIIAGITLVINIIL